MECELCHRRVGIINPTLRASCRVELLGDRVSRVLESVGIHKTPGCGCHERQEQLNELDRKVRAMLLSPRGVFNLIVDWANYLKNRKRVLENTVSTPVDGRWNYFGADETTPPNLDLLPERFRKSEGEAEPNPTAFVFAPPIPDAVLNLLPRVSPNCRAEFVKAWVQTRPTV